MISLEWERSEDLLRTLLLLSASETVLEAFAELSTVEFCFTHSALDLLVQGSTVSTCVLECNALAAKTNHRHK